MSSLRIVFMGTPDFAVPSLEILNKHFDVVGVITAPDKPAGRGKKLRKSAVKEFAETNDLRVLQPTNLKDLGFVEELRAIKADLQVVVAFRMLPEVVWNMPPKGTINLHGSLLPQYRGAAPINWAIINGEKKTGVTTFFLQHQIDTGDLIDQTEIEISPNMTAGELHDKMMEVGAQTLLETVKKIDEGKAKGTPQHQVKEQDLKSAPKIFKEDCKIDWSKEAEKVHNHIRGLSPYPAAWTVLQRDEKKVNFKILKSKLSNVQNLSPGEIKVDADNRLLVGTANSDVEILELQMEGKKRMDVEAFLRGFQFESGDRFE
ncbi:methionyl-tRNA formyltransferase [Halocola ammonii]